LNVLFYSRPKIDNDKWNNCIDKAPNGVIYAYTFFLDAMSENWDALILDDYKMVMPLTWKSKYGIYYLYQPFFCAQSGVFGEEITPEVVKAFFDHVPEKFKYWDIHLNRNNLFSIPGFPMLERANYILPLPEPYDVLNNRYIDSHRRNITRALNSGNKVKEKVAISDIIFLAKEQAKFYSPITDKDYQNFSRLLEQLRSKKMLETYGVYSAQNNLLASCVWIFAHQRAYYILVGNHPESKLYGSSHLLIDHFIRTHAGENLTIDFEGSSIPSLAFFYRGFGSQLEKYPAIKVNKLPFILRLFKK
jgi:hypothetical protein